VARTQARLGRGLRRYLRFAELFAQHRDVYDPEEEGLPEFAGERTRTPSENAQERDAFHQMDDSEHAKEATAETAERARLKRREETGGGDEPGHTDDALADRVDAFVLHFRGLQGGVRMIASPFSFALFRAA